ncbi:MAG TPA: DUF4438 domain-containing protein [Bacillota bacterium]|nr:DUF4438 domain-containing protein [Bacillota bacterium]HOH10449.1 DUF4438 domain-containing protein [Bacillota bacterium]HOY89152.1 DUF4438 domain-containing protein [Bacillota bacterium]HPI01065.1 DUF4438 domain-containing protein [Bacillota bacterium]HPM63162.1 DUF4438 domain-containing protein [Bacillota bacterium]
MLRTNRDKVVMISVMGAVAPPVRRLDYRVSADGEPFVLPGTGGITYNVLVGDPCFGWAGDHVEPGVSTCSDIDRRSEGKNAGYNTYACIGNKARVATGDAKGAEGVVVGHHGGIEHVLIDFEPEAMEKMLIDDKILVKGYGQGLKLLDYPSVKVMNVDPDLLDKMGIKEEGSVLDVPVALEVPAKLMGSGLGMGNCYSGDYDITTTDKRLIADLGIDKLRFGDVVAITDADNRFGRSYMSGAVTIGIVVHSDCLIAGHGPGVATVLTDVEGKIRPVLDKKANIAAYLGLGRYRK